MPEILDLFWTSPIEMRSRVLVVGGGIAGLCLALALSKKGLPSVVFERNKFEDTTGTGIQLSPNATDLLFQAGLKKLLLARARVSTEIVTRHWRTGRVTSRIPLGSIVEKHCATPYLQILRSELVDVLVSYVRDDRHVELRENENVDSLDQWETGASVSSNGAESKGCLVVGADGARSTIRGLIGQISDPPFSKWHAWRTTIRSESTDLVSQRTTVWCGPRSHVVTYPVDEHGQINCVFITRSSSHLDETWSERGTLADLQSCFVGWHKDVFELLDRVDQPKLFRWGLFRHDKLTGGWTRGRCTLIGDACHCVLPFLAQGAALAIEDAFTLSNCLDEYPTDVSSALRDYEKMRLARTNSIQRRSVRMGHVYHLPAPFSWLRDVSAKWATGEIVRNIYASEASRIDS